MSRRLNVGLISLLALATLAAGIFFWRDWRHIPPDLNVTGTVDGGQAEVTGAVWQEIGSPWNAEDRWVSFLILLENQGTVDLEVQKVSIMVRPFAPGQSAKTLTIEYRTRYTPIMVVKAGERRSMWAGGMGFPPDKNKPVVWSDVLINVKVKPADENILCNVPRTEDIEILQSGYDKNGEYLIFGKASNYPRRTYLFPRVHVTFFDEFGNFIGRGTIPIEKDGSFEKKFVPDQEPCCGPAFYLIHGEFIKGKINSFEANFAEGEWDPSCD